MLRSLRYSRALRTSATNRPNLLRTPPEVSQRPEPLVASLTRTPMVRPDAVFFGVFDDEFEFGEFLDDGDDVLAEFLWRG